MNAPRIVVEPNAHHLLNLGDVAMLQVAVERLSGLWPDSRIDVITEAPARLGQFCPAAVPLDASGRRLWFEDHYSTYALHRALPKSMSNRLLSLERSTRRRWPAGVNRLIRMRAALRNDDTGPLDDFLAAVSTADLVVSTGAGALTDTFAPLALAVLDLLEGAKQSGAVAALLGHGIGPLTDRALVERARAVLPELDLISIREQSLGGPLLESLGVQPDRVVSTGDDAIELAYRARRRDATEARRLGFNLRIARYSEVDVKTAAAVGAVVRDAAARHRAEVVPIPISVHPREADAEVIASALASGAKAAETLTPLSVVELIGQCRLVVTGSYHAAVFALAQGIPAVGVTRSAYYDAKFVGLNDQFGGTLGIVSLGQGNVERRLMRAIDEAWENAESVRPQLLGLAREQVEEGRGAYRRLHALLSGRSERP
jgi:polysaccharide pyruvyl transferase WcaK-like protein